MLAGYGGASFRGRRDSLGFRVSVGDYHWMEKGGDWGEKLKVIGGNTSVNTVGQ